MAIAMETALGFLLLLACFTFATVQANATGRIVGGYAAKSAQFPHQISLRMRHRHICGGSILSENFILTAAHCVVEEGTKPYNASFFTIRAGTHNRIAGGFIYQVKRVIVNENYSGFINDLALLELDEGLVYSPAIQPIELYEEEVPSGGEVIISGWGLLETNADEIPIILQWNTVAALNRTQCGRKILMFEDSLICLDHPKGAGACNGDSGGPATYQGKLVGVAGFVVLGCGSTRPDGYAKISYHIDWIKSNMQMTNH